LSQAQMDFSLGFSTRGISDGMKICYD